MLKQGLTAKIEQTILSNDDLGDGSVLVPVFTGGLVYVRINTNVPLFHNH